MGVVGCYSVDLYCDHPDHDRWDDGYAFQFTGKTESDCLSQAKREGWKINKSKNGGNGRYYTLCPKHSGRKLKTV